MKSTEKSEGLNRYLNENYNREEYIKNDTCVFCHKKVTPESFRDALSLREFEISGICQECQDKIFGK